MKRIILLLVVLVCAINSYSQYPLTQNLGSPSTLMQVPANGGLIAGLINRSFTDTTAANSSYLKGYAGAQIFTTSDSSLWFRSLGATMWVKYGSASGGASGGAWAVGGNSFPALAPDNFTIGTNNFFSFKIKTDNTVRLSIPAAGIPYSNNATDSVLVRDNAGNMGLIPKDSIGTNIYNSDGALTGDRSVDGDSHSLSATNFSDFTILAQNGTYNTGVFGDGADLDLYGARIGGESLIRVKSDSIMINPYLGKLKIDSLESGAGTKALRWNPSTGAVTVADTTIGNTGTVTSVGTGYGLSGGTITTTGTIIVDSATLSGYYLRKKDSVNGGYYPYATNPKNYITASDTATMLSPYLRSNVAAATYQPIGSYVKVSDTASMLSPYLRKVDTASLSSRINTKLNISDTSTMLSPYVRTSRSLTINGTAYDLSADRSWSVGTVTSVATSTGTGITGGTITSTGTIAADTTLLSTRLWRQKGIDSVQANVNAKVNISDTSSMLNNYVRSVYRKTGTDSVFMIKGAGNIFAYKDSTGGGGGSTLTISKPLTGTSYNGSSPVTIAIAKASSTDSGYVVPNQILGSIGVALDGQGGTISTGSKGYITIPYSCTILNWYVAADASGSIVVDVKRSGASIVGAGNKPTLSSAQSANAAVSGWTSTSVSAGDILQWNVDSATTVSNVSVVLKVIK